MSCDILQDAWKRVEFRGGKLSTSSPPGVVQCLFLNPFVFLTYLKTLNYNFPKTKCTYASDLPFRYTDARHTGSHLNWANRANSSCPEVAKGAFTNSFLVREEPQLPALSIEIFRVDGLN